MKKILVVVCLAFLSLFTLPALALEKEPFTQERFDALQTEGEVVLIDVFATWCPTCKKQQEALTQFRAKNPDAEFHILVVDFDKDKDWVRHFRAPRQSTLLLYAGDKQHWYSVAETRYEVIAEEINKAIAAASKS